MLYSYQFVILIPNGKFGGIEQSFWNSFLYYVTWFDERRNWRPCKRGYSLVVQKLQTDMECAFFEHTPDLI